MARDDIEPDATAQSAWSRPLVVRDAVGWLTVYLVLLLFVPSRLVVGPLGSAGAPSMLFGLCGLLLWTTIYLRAQRSMPTRSRPIRVALAVFLLCVGVSYTIAMSGPMSSDEVSPADVAVLIALSWSGTLLLTHDAVTDRSRLDTLIWRFTVCGGLIAVLGLVQVVTRQLWVDQISIPGLASAPPYGLVTRGGYPRPAGTSIHPIEFGALLAILLPVSLHVAFFHLHRRPWVRWWPAAAIAAIVPLTSSRSAYLGALIGLLVCMIGWPRIRRLWAAAVGGAGAIAMSVVAPNFLDSIVGLFTGASEDPSITSRTDSFSLAFGFVARDPWFGRGLGTFLPKYRIFDNQYLLLLVTIGVVGTLAFLALGATAVVMLQRRRRLMTAASDRDLAMSLTASLTAGFVSLLMFDAFAFPMTMGALFFVLGMSGAFGTVVPLTRKVGDSQT